MSCARAIERYYEELSSKVKHGLTASTCSTYTVPSVLHALSSLCSVSDLDNSPVILPYSKNYLECRRCRSPDYMVQHGQLPPLYAVVFRRSKLWAAKGEGVLTISEQSRWLDLLHLHHPGLPMPLKATSVSVRRSRLTNEACFHIIRADRDSISVPSSIVPHQFSLNLLLILLALARQVMKFLLC